MVKTKIPKLVYNAMFKAVFTDNKVVLARLIESILEYCDIDISIKDKDLVIKSNELSLNNYLDKQFICDYIVKLDEDTELNIEINKATYPGLVQRNMTYSFKIYSDYFKLGDSYKKLSKYTLLQVNFNNYKNPNGKNINRFYMIDTNDINNVLSKNLAIVNVDIASCYKLVYNNTKLNEVSDLERFASIMCCEYLEDISNILGGEMLNMEEKEKFLESIKEKSQDKDISKAIKFEDSIDYRFDLVEEEALKRGIEQEKISTIKNLFSKNISVEDIADVTGKSIDEIKEIINSIKE